jgi:hypothetical protein
LVAFSSIPFAPAAQAKGGHQRMCVTRGEWLAVHKSMTRARVHSIFNSAGKQILINYLGDGYVCEFQGYRTCVGTSDSYVRVSFQNHNFDQPGMRLDAKYMYIYN